MKIFFGKKGNNSRCNIVRPTLIRTRHSPVRISIDSDSSDQSETIPEVNEAQLYSSKIFIQSTSPKRKQERHCSICVIAPDPPNGGLCHIHRSKSFSNYRDLRVQQSILRTSGATPNATCHMGHISACHVSAYENSDALRLLLTFGAYKDRRDKFGRTPLHLAAWAGNICSIAMLLDFPIDLQNHLETGVTAAVEEEIKKLRAGLARSLIDATCDLAKITDLPPLWKDNFDHKCKKYMMHLPKFFSGWTPLHVASYAGQYDATRLLLAAGADPNSKDAMRQTPLDVVGAACYLESSSIHVKEYVKSIRALVEFGGRLNVSTPSSNSSLHTAVELCSEEAVQELLNVGAPIWHQNAAGNTPLHECVAKKCKETLRVLANHQIARHSHQPVDVVNSSGYTVLHAAILASWVSGVYIALEAGADVTFEAPDGRTALHIAAYKGNMDIIGGILDTVGKLGKIKNTVNYKSKKIHIEPPIFSAIRSGNLECVEALLDEGAILEMNYYEDPITGDTIKPRSKFNQKTINMILHATAAVCSVDMMKLLLDHDKSLEELLCYKCLYLEGMTPVEVSAYHNRCDLFRFLLQKTLQRKRKLREPFDHSRLLHIIATRNHEDLFEELIEQIPKAVRTAKGKEYYPLHDAARNDYRDLIVQLIHNGADLSEEDNTGVTAVSLVIENISKPTEFLEKLLDNYIKPSSDNLHNINCEIIVDYRALIPTTVDKLDKEDQLNVLTSLLKTKDGQNQRKLLAHPLIESFLYLKWKTLSNYFYLMMFLYFLFVISFSVFTMSVIYYKDKYNTTISEHPSYPLLWNPNIWQYIFGVFLAIVLIQDISHIKLTYKTWHNKVSTTEFWLKFLAYFFAVATFSVISVKCKEHTGTFDWLRHLATVALALACLNIMIMLSKTPMSGYYIQMFYVVSRKVIEILFTFLILIFAFSFCFMIQFHSNVPFDDPWAAFVKTLVMMTSEFDYGDTFTPEKAQHSTKIQFLRVVFVIFMIFTAIVLMNLMTAVAVDDVQNLVENGNLKRLEKQVVFLNNLHMSRGKTFFFHFLDLYQLFKCDNVDQIKKIKPVNDGECCFSLRIKEAIINKAQQQLDKVEREAESNKLESKFKQLSQDLSNEFEPKLEKLSQNVSRHIISELKMELKHVQNSLDQRIASISCSRFRQSHPF